jgi:hypothetical protein
MPICFCLSYSVDDDLLAKLVNGPLAFVPAATGNISVSFNHRDVASRRQLIATVSKWEELSTTLADAFRELAEGRLPKGSNRKEAASVLDQNGLLKPNHNPPLSALPNEFQKFCNRADNELFAVLRKTVDLVRWRGGLSGGKQQLLSRFGFQFSLDNEAMWNPVPHHHAASLKFVRVGFPSPTGGFSQAVFDDVARLYPTVSEPVSRQLFREAWELRQLNPRSALVIGWAAIEIGCKEFIQSAAPLSSWLVVEAASPPVDKILKSYIPTLPSSFGKVVIPNEPRKLVQKAMKARNELVHRGELGLSPDGLEEILRAINDLLWLLNYYAGHPWALNYVSGECLALLQSGNDSH